MHSERSRVLNSSLNETLVTFPFSRLILNPVASQPLLSMNINEAIRFHNLSASNGIQDAILSLTYACEEVKKYDEACNHAKFYADQENFYE